MKERASRLLTIFKPRLPGSILNDRAPTGRRRRQARRACIATLH